MKKIVLFVVVALAAGGAWAGPCDPPPARPGGHVNIRPVTSEDPNEIVGPLGMGYRRYVEPWAWMGYTIYFENKASATAAAQEVRVTMPTDVALDWSTLELGEIAVGDTVCTALSGKRGGTALFALSDGVARVKAKVSVGDGSVVWYLRSWDETTADNFPEGAEDGFLPPNDSTGRGEGHVSFRVRLRSNAVPGAVVEESAVIVFDANEPIPTDPAWRNVVYGDEDCICEIIEETLNSAKAGEIVALPKSVALSELTVADNRLRWRGSEFRPRANYGLTKTETGIRVEIDPAAAAIGSGVDATGREVVPFKVENGQATVGVGKSVSGFYYSLEASDDLDFQYPMETPPQRGTGNAMNLTAPAEGGRKFYRVRVSD